MAQPSIANYFGTRKRSATEEEKIVRAKKVLLLEGSDLKPCVEPVEDNKLIIPDVVKSKLQEDLESVSLNKIANPIVPSKPKILRATTKNDKTKPVPGQKNIDDLFNDLKKTLPVQEIAKEHVTPPSTPTKANAMDKVRDETSGPSLKEIRRKLTRSARLQELKASIGRFDDGAKKLKELKARRVEVPESPKLKNFKSIELEVQTSPQKLFSPEKAYLSPKKEPSARKNLIHLLSPTRNAVAALPASPSKQFLEETSKPALTLPFKYRYVAEMFRSIDTVSQILYNRKETITFKKVKPAVEEMLKRNLTLKHLAQIKHIYPDAFDFTQEKLRVFGAGSKLEQWELVLLPKVAEVEHMTADILLERRRKLFNIMLDKVKDYHQEFLMSLDPPMQISRDKIARWHPEFDIEQVPDLELAVLPQPPTVEKPTTGKDVLEKAREMFNCNTRMEQALIRLKEARESNPQKLEGQTPPEAPTSILKGIPKALLEKVRQKQAAKALLSITRSADKEKDLLMYSRLPELARLSRNLFVSEKKSVLPLDVVVEKLGNCYKSPLSKADFEEHLKLIAKEVPGWLVFHNLRNAEFLKLAKSADASVVINKLENLVKEKSEA